MKLEIGRYYRTRDGRKVGPVKVSDHGEGSEWPFSVPQEFVTYRQDGTHFYWGGCRPNDIIAEWTDEPQSKLYNSLTDEQKEAALREPADTGTLAELNVKPGDVVECVNLGVYSLGRLHTIRDGQFGMAAYSEDDSCFKLDSKCEFRIISRASTTQSPVRTVTRTSLEIVPGVYGPLNVIASIGGLVSMQISKEFLTKGEVDELLSHLTAIRDAMENND